MKFDQFQTSSHTTWWQTLATCWAQQCCERLHGPKLEIISPSDEMNMEGVITEFLMVLV